MKEICYVCAEKTRLVKYPYPDGMKTVCVDCYQALVLGTITYEENMGIRPKTVVKQSKEDKKKRLEQLFTDTLIKNWNKWGMPKGWEAQA